MAATEKVAKKLQIVRDYNIIPSGVEYFRLWKIEDAIGSTYDYNGVKYNEEAVFYNAQFALKIKHELVEMPFWIVVFDGANYREEKSQIVIATKRRPYMNQPVLKVDDISLLENDDFDGKETVSQLVEAFEYVFFREDESGLYTDGAEPLVIENPDIVQDIAESIEEIDFVVVHAKINRNNPCINSIKEIGEKYYEAARGNMYQVHIVAYNELQEIFQNLTKDEAETLYLQKCHEWYKEGGICAYQKLYVGEDKSMRENDFDDYYGSDQYYEAEDNAHVVMEVM